MKNIKVQAKKVPKYYKDISVLENIKQFLTANGWVRAVYEGEGEWSIYRMGDSAFIHCGNAVVKKRSSCKTIYETFMNN